MALSIFFPSVSGLNAQSDALGTVSDNIANMRTVGYKSAETMFYTLLGSQPAVKSNASGLNSSRVDVHGVGDYTRYNILQGGNITSTDGRFDVALQESNAFFMVNDGYDNTYYTRAGDFNTLALDGKTYLVNNNGYFVQGFKSNGDGTFASEPSNIEFEFLEKMPSVPTSDVDITANVPADGVEKSAYSLTIYGENNDGANMNMVFTKVPDKINTWNVSFVVEGGEVASEPIEAVFSDEGLLLSPKNFDITVNWEDGSSNNIHMNIENMTQYAGNDGETYVYQDGAPSGQLTDTYINEKGVLVSEYSNKRTVEIAKLAVVGFTAPENLVPVSGTLFEAYSDVGESHYVMASDTDSSNIVLSQSLESSNVDVETEFAEMIQVQRAYSMNANAFTVANEMTSVVVDLKS